MSDRMKKIFSFGLPFVSCVVAVFFLLPSCGDNEEIVQRKSEKSYSVDEGKNQLVVEIPCRKAWSLSGAADEKLNPSDESSFSISASGF